jgi:hypothetical protein
MSRLTVTRRRTRGSRVNTSVRCVLRRSLTLLWDSATSTWSICRETPWQSYNGSTIGLVTHNRLGQHSVRRALVLSDRLRRAPGQRHVDGCHSARGSVDFRRNDAYRHDHLGFRERQQRHDLGSQAR